VIYMEEASGDATKATLAVNAADMQATGSRIPFRVGSIGSAVIFGRQCPIEG
jgi:hypothetical protein